MFNVTGVGRLGQDPEMTYLESGKVVCKFSLSNSEWDAKAKENGTGWYSCECWGKTAEVVGEYVKKGHKLAVTGELTTSRWTDKEGVAKSKPVIKVMKVELLEKKEQ